MYTGYLQNMTSRIEYHVWCIQTIKYGFVRYNGANDFLRNIYGKAQSIIHLF